MNQISQWFSKQPEHVRSALMLLFLSALVLAGFLQVTHCAFVNFDDTDYVTENLRIQNGVSLKSIAWAFQSRHAGNWHPLTWISHMIDFNLYGLKPAGHHFTNLLLHLGNTLLLFLVLKEITGAPGRSFFVAALFAIHPMHVESVAWVSERKDLLSAFFGMWTLWFYGRYVRERMNGEKGRGAYWVSLVAFALGLMSKPMLVTLPFVLLLLDFWPLGRMDAKGARANGGLVLEKLPFFALSFAVSCVTYIVQNAGGAVVQATLWFRLSNAFIGYCRYIAKLLWPTKLSVFYPLLDSGSVWGLLALVLLVVISGLIFVVSRKRGYLFSGWFWFLGMLVPVIGFVQVGSQSMADRYSYLPSIGLFIALVWVAGEIRKWNGALVLGGVLAVGILTFLTQRQVSFWRDSATLFQRVLQVNPETDTIQTQVGAALAFVGRPEEAWPHFKRAVEINPHNYEAELSWGTALVGAGRDAEAIPHLQRSVEGQPKSARAHDNFGLAFSHLKEPAKAESEFEKALQLEPENPAIMNHLGFALLEQRKLGDAEEMFLKALQRSPGLRDAHIYLGFIYVTQNRLDEALVHSREAVRLDPEDTRARENLKVVIAKKEAERTIPKP